MVCSQRSDTDDGWLTTNHLYFRTEMCKSGFMHKSEFLVFPVESAMHFRMNIETIAFALGHWQMYKEQV